MDWNSHMANTAYLNKVVDARVLALAEKGFPLEEFIRLRLGVVIMKDELEYKREIKWMEEIDISFSLAGLAPDGSRFKIQNEVRRANGDLAARITSTGGFMDLDARKLVAPPPAGVIGVRHRYPRGALGQAYLRHPRHGRQRRSWQDRCRW
jgi:acyl-CoA thioester hydrolase